MLATQIVYAIAGSIVFALGMRGALLHPVPLGQILCFNVSGGGIFLLFVAIAYRGPDRAPDAVPLALVLTGIVVAVSATAFALALARRLRGPGDE